jgi:hypothetical protein
MNIEEKDIAALDFIIDEITKSGYSIDAQKLINSRIITEDDDRKAELEFIRLLEIIKYYEVAQVNFDLSKWSTVEQNQRTDKFKRDGGFKIVYQKQLKRIEKEEEKERLSTRKLRWDSKISKWKVITFWPVFIFGLAGFIIGVYNFIENKRNAEYKESQDKTNQQMKSELSRLHTLVLDKKMVDSLHNLKK